ncbi:MAG: transporter substrate-binding domain-containing protein [Alphaproteobacteria bacterium]|nr:transporter substrate-binding domain-containing protein [Alphaproteobacteria bacterium]
MNKLAGILLSVIISVALSWLVLNQHPGIQGSSARKTSVYEKVISSGTLRCGYFEEAPFTFIDPNTGKKSGIAIELAEKIASELGLKVEWTTAVNFGALVDDLTNNKYDAICASLFSLPRGGRIDYTAPYAYVPVYAYTQAGRAEFDNKLEQLDWSKISVAGLDGEGGTTAARKKLPEAKFVLLPQNMQIADMLTSVADKKADMAFVMPTVFKNFDKNNPGKLTKVAADKPFHVFTVTFGIKSGEPALKNMLDFMMRNLAAEGYVEGLFRKYDPDNLLFQPESLYKAAR